LGGILNGGYSEGFGDALTLIGTRQPCVGRDFFGPGTCIRNATDVVTWPPINTEVHQVGRIYAGFVQELITQLQSSFDPNLAIDISRNLVMGAALANPKDIPDAVRQSFILDSGGDLGTCSPRFWFLAIAAASRNIPRPPDCATMWLAGFAFNNGVWRVEKHVRLLGDITGDGKADIVAFGDDGVWVATSNGAGFDVARFVIANFGYNAGGWRVDKHPRFLADVNGDGKADIVAFGDDGVWLATSNGSGFNPPQFVLADFGYNAGGWRVEDHPRLLADFNNDGKADIVGFGYDGVLLATSNGAGFSAPVLAAGNFGFNAGGWRTEKHVRLLGEVTGDGKPDIVGFGDDGVWVSDLLP
jgi:FG-GAP-like repeat